MFILLGRIAGVSGILFNAAKMPVTNLWGYAFLLGLVLGAALLHAFTSIPKPSVEHSYITLIASGLLVGFGTKLGSGCTSGHGICGLARLSKRSIVATCLFMAAAMVTVLIRKHIL
jgi:uncharacterized membrane protein YedE/YeeE